MLERTWGSETSQYPEEEKSIEILSVAASERSIGQTKQHVAWGCRAFISDLMLDSQTGLEKPTIQGDSPVDEIEISMESS